MRAKNCGWNAYVKILHKPNLVSKKWPDRASCCLPGLLAKTTPELRQLIEDMGYVGFGQQSGAVGPLSDFTRLPRYPMAGSYSDMPQFRTKINTKPLPVKQQVPDSTLIDEDNLKPELELTVATESFQKKQLRCYASGQGEIAVEWLDDDKTRFITSATRPLPVGS